MLRHRLPTKRGDTTVQVDRTSVAERGPNLFATWLLPCVIFLLTFIAFFPTLHNGFVNWDDDWNIYENLHYRGLGWTQLRWMFTTFHLSNYRPLTWVTLGLDYLLWGMNPFGYHLTSLLLHVINATLFYFLAYRLLCLARPDLDTRGEFPLQVAAGFSALIFAIHPLRAESVAWASARNDVVSALFYIWTILCYLSAVAIPRGNRFRLWRMAGAVLVYGFSLLSKGIGLTLPVVLVVLDIYPLRRLGASGGNWFGPEARRIWWEKVPFLIVALAAGVTAVLAKQETAAIYTIASYGLVPRFAQVLYGLAFYLWKTLIPLDLSPLYPLTIFPGLWDLRLLLAGALVLTLSVGLFLVRRRWPAGLATWVSYVAILLPVIGIVTFGLQLVADRYSYLSCLGWTVLGGATVLYFLEAGSARWIHAVTLSLAGLVVLGLAVLTWKQTEVWHDSEKLWRQALSVSPSATAYNNLGSALLNQDKVEEAISQFRRALQLNSSYEEPWYNLGLALAKRGELEEAIKYFRSALEIDPRDVRAHNNLAITLAKRGEVEEAMKHFRRVLEINPADVPATKNLALTLAQRGNLEEAIKYFHSALKLDPTDTTTLANLATALLQHGDVDEAIRYLRRALEISPADPAIHEQLAIVLSIKGELEEAMRHFRQALEISPRDPGVHTNLGIALARRGDLEGAIGRFRAALSIDPEFADAHAGLGRALALQGKRNEAMVHYQEALRIMKSQRESLTPGAKRSN